MLNIIRWALLGTLLLFSLVTLALSGSLISGLPADVPAASWVGLDLAVAVITIVVVLPSIVIDFFRKGAFTSMVVVELAWTFVLKILWVAAAGETTSILSLDGVTGSCTFFDDFGDPVNDPIDESFCHKDHALQAFTWLSWLILFGWLITLLTLAAMAHSRGNTSVWTSPVTSMDFRARKGTSAAPMQQNAYGQAPMQQQQNTGYSQGYPPPSSGYDATPPPAQQYTPHAAQV